MLPPSPHESLNSSTNRRLEPTQGASTDPAALHVRFGVQVELLGRTAGRLTAGIFSHRAVPGGATSLILVTRDPCVARIYRNNDKKRRNAIMPLGCDQKA